MREKAAHRTLPFSTQASPLCNASPAAPGRYPNRGREPTAHITHVKHVSVRGGYSNIAVHGLVFFALSPLTANLAVRGAPAKSSICRGKTRGGEDGRTRKRPTVESNAEIARNEGAGASWEGRSVADVFSSGSVPLPIETALLLLRLLLCSLKPAHLGLLYIFFRLCVIMRCLCCRVSSSSPPSYLQRNNPYGVRVHRRAQDPPAAREAGQYLRSRVERG